MNIEELIKSIYLGDRCCKRIVLDGWNKQILIQVDTISRVPKGSNTWDYNNKQDIEDGYLVFSDVTAVEMTPIGFLPNDQINALEIVEDNNIASDAANIKVFEISIDSVDREGKHQEVLVKIVATGMHLEDPQNPGVTIIE